MVKVNEIGCNLSSNTTSFIYSSDIQKRLQLNYVLSSIVICQSAQMTQQLPNQLKTNQFIRNKNRNFDHCFGVALLSSILTEISTNK